MAHVFDKYFRRHGHYPRIRLRNGAQKMTVEFAPGYVRVKTTPPFGGEVYILASTIRHLIKDPSFLALIRRQEEDFDVPAAVHANSQVEQALLQTLRQQKKAHVEDPEARQRQHRRFLNAQARAARRRDDD